jgi:peptide/nickel transport system permease protein
MSAATSSDAIAAPPEEARRRSVLHSIVRPLQREPALAIGLTIVSAMGILAIFAPIIATHDPDQFHTLRELEGPSGEFWFGTDRFGRDIFSRIAYGTRITFMVGFGATFLAFLIGAPAGIAAGYFRGSVDHILNAATDLLLAFPQIILAMFLLAIVGQGTQPVILAIALMIVPTFARQARAPVLAEVSKDYVLAAQCTGASPVRIMLFHLFPNVQSSLLVRASVALPFAILAEAALSFLGLGVQPPTPTWGNMLSDARGFLETKPLMAAFPGIFISVTVLGFSLLGDGFRDALDPKLRR